MDMQRLDSTLGQLGITSRYLGSPYLCYAACLAAERPDLLLHVTKELYPVIAAHFGTTCPCVTRNIRTVIDVVWTLKRSVLQSLSPYPLNKKPTVAQFIAILATPFMS